MKPTQRLRAGTNSAGNRTALPGRQQKLDSIWECAPLLWNIEKDVHVHEHVNVDAEAMIVDVYVLVAVDGLGLRSADLSQGSRHGIRAWWITQA